MCFHCYSLDFVIIQNNSFTSKIKNSDTSQLLYSQLFLLSSCLNSFDHPYNFSFISVLLPSLLSLPFYIQFSATLTTLVNFFSSPPHYPFITLNWTFSSESYCLTIVEHHYRKSSRAVLSLCVHGNHHQQDMRHCQLILLSSIRSLFYSPQGGFHIFSAVLHPTTSHPSNSQSRWHQFWLHRKDSSPQKGHPSTSHQHICTPIHLCSHSSILPLVTLEEEPFFLTKSYPFTSPLPALSGRDLAL